MLSRIIVARRSCVAASNRRFLSDTLATPSRPIRKTVTKEERQALREARKLQAAKVLQKGESGEAVASGASATANSISKHSRWVWYIGVGVPSALLVWGMNDENSPPAKFSSLIGLTGMIRNFSEDFAKPSHEKLLPDWSQVSFHLSCLFVCLLNES